jgi:hypothetical protein
MLSSFQKIIQGKHYHVFHKRGLIFIPLNHSKRQAIQKFSIKKQKKTHTYGHAISFALDYS